MEQNLKPDERELVKLVQYFKKRAQILIAEDKLDDEYRQMMETCDKLIEQLNLHARNRGLILAERETLENMIKDNAKCPKCVSNEKLKLTGTDTNEQGWRSNKYKCRSCNIEFVWNAPNNPWHMIPYVEEFISDTEKKLSEQDQNDPSYEPTAQMIEGMKMNLERLRPVVNASDMDMKELEAREIQMAELVNKMKKHLMIEKIKMEN
jgi:hypothetical protein